MIKSNLAKKPQQFDVIIVYNGFIAASAKDIEYKGKSPFLLNHECSSYNKSYEYFLKYCKIIGLKAAFSTTHDICGPGLFNSYWIFNKKWWRQKNKAKTHLVFDKFSCIKKFNRSQSALLSTIPNDVVYFHNKKNRNIFDNKLSTYNALPDFSVPTVKIDLLSKKNIITAKKNLLKKINQHKYFKDFSNIFILKDQFGSCGKNIFKVKENNKIFSLGKKNKTISYILQPFINASGFHFKKYKGNIDLRVIICNNKIIQSYIRIPKKGEFRANACQGGRVIYLKKHEIPTDVIKMAKAINRKLSHQNSFHAIDFIKSSSGHLYFIEGNITPGLNWFNKIDEKKAKELMRCIIKTLKTMV